MSWREGELRQPRLQVELPQRFEFLIAEPTEVERVAMFERSTLAGVHDALLEQPEVFAEADEGPQLVVEHRGNEMVTEVTCD